MRPKGGRRAVAAVLLCAVVMTVSWFIRGYHWPVFGVVLVAALGLPYVLYRLIDWGPQ